MSDYHTRYHYPFDWNSMYSEGGHFTGASRASAHNPCAYDATGRPVSLYQQSIASFGHTFQQLNINADELHISQHQNDAPFASSLKYSPTDSGLGYSPPTLIPSSSPDHFTQHSQHHSLPSTADSTVLSTNAVQMPATSTASNALSVLLPSKSRKSKGIRPEKTRTDCSQYRVAYSDFQRARLEEEFLKNAYIEIRRKEALSLELNLTSRQVKIWFQNRRAKGRRSEQKKSKNLEGYEVKSAGVKGSNRKTEDFSELPPLTVQIPAVSSANIPAHSLHNGNISELAYNSSYYQHHFSATDPLQLLRPTEN